MKEQLIQYVELLFAGVPDSEEIKQEILQNTLDRYDDLIAQGKQPEAAYRLAISGIGDINEVLNNEQKPVSNFDAYYSKQAIAVDAEDKKKKRAVAIALYICCVIPVIVLGNIGNGGLGVCMMFLMIAAATALLIMTSKDEDDEEDEDADDNIQDPNKALKKSIHTFTGILTLPLYLILSFSTGAWSITWILFPISACVDGLIDAIIDLKEANKHED